MFNRQRVYQHTYKVAPPEINFNQPQKHPLITTGITIGYILTGFTLLAGLFGLNIELLLMGVGIGAASTLAYFFRTAHFKKDIEIHHSAVERKWLESDGFIKVRDFFILLGFTPQTSFDLTETVGTDSLVTNGYTKAEGYYVLTTVEGLQTISAVAVESFVSKKGNLKLKTTILQDV